MVKLNFRKFRLCIDLIVIFEKYIKRGKFFEEKRLLFVFLLMVLSMILAACGGNSSKETAVPTDKNNSGGESEKPKFISILTGGTGGTYYPLGGAFANIVSDETGIETNAET